MSQAQSQGTVTQVGPTPLLVPPASRPRRARWWRRRRTLLGLVLVLVLVLLVVVGVALRPSEAPLATGQESTVGAPLLTARGVVRPVAQSRVGTVTGGVLERVSVSVGSKVDAAAELALVRSRADGSVEVLTAPRAGTVLSVPVSLGDTLAPGAVVAIVADVSKLQVETTDLDEFLVARVAAGQRVTLTVPALDNRTLRGVVREVALQPDADNYPATIDLTDAVPPDLRVGMSVRLTFDNR